MSAVTNDKGTRLELTLGELVKTLVSACKSGTFCTTLPLREDVDGMHRFGPQSPSSVEKWSKFGKEYPFGTLVSYLINENGEPCMLLANNAVHSRNIAANPKVALYVQNPATPGQKGARVTLVGEIERITDPKELKECSSLYTERFPDQAQPLQDDRFEKYFSMFKLLIKDIYYVSGFGVVTNWVSVDEYKKAEADPLAESSSQLVDEWNRSRQAEFQDLIRVYFAAELGLTEAETPRVTFLDRFGFDFRFRFATEPRKGADKPPRFDTREYRIGFGTPVMSKEEAQSAMFKILQDVWERMHGYAEDGDGGSLPPMALKRGTDMQPSQAYAMARPSVVSN